MFCISCGVKWPCLTFDEHDYATACPLGWVMQQCSVCASSSNIAGPCGSVAQTGEMTVSEKKAFAARCNVPWLVFRQNHFFVGLLYNRVPEGPIDI